MEVMLIALYMALPVALTLIVVEYICKISDMVQYSPSHCITQLADCSAIVWIWMGQCLAKLSSCLLFIRLDLFGDSVVDICDALFKLITTPVFSLKGYFEKVVQYGRSFYVYLGTGLIFGGVLAVIYYYFEAQFNILAQQLSDVPPTPNKHLNIAVFTCGIVVFVFLIRILLEGKTDPFFKQLVVDVNNVDDVDGFPHLHNTHRPHRHSSDSLFY